MEPVHLTCQRFELSDAQLPALLKQLRLLAASLAPFALAANALLTTYSPYRALHVLKWEVAVTPELRCFSDTLERLLKMLAITSLYGSGFQSTWVTALESIRPIADPSMLMQPTFPHQLFVGREIEVSRIEGPFEFETLARIELKTHEH